MTDTEAMAIALEEAALAPGHGDVPVGAVVVVDDQVVARRHNERELRSDPTAHAEVLALRDASERLGTWRLEDATLFVTLEPCAMCAGAMIHARLGRLVYGAPDPKAGAAGSVLEVLNHPKLNHQMAVTANVLAEECGELLRGFFRDRR